MAMATVSVSALVLSAFFRFSAAPAEIETGGRKRFAAALFFHKPRLREDCTMQCYEHLKLKTNVKRINGSTDVAPVFRAILDAESELDRDKEHFWILCLNTKNHILRVELITLGLLDQTVVHPREVFRPAIGCSAKSVILAHNHPSGDPTPSDKDEQLTARLIDCGKMLDIPILDHVVIGEGSEYWSMREHFNDDGCHRPALDKCGW